MLKGTGRLLAGWLALAVLAAMVPGLAWAQEARGTITGRVADAQSLALPGVVVEAVNDATGVKTSVTTNAQGNYSIPFLNPGSYTVSFTLDGFKPVRRKADLHVAETLAVNAAMEVGGVAETVVVIANAATLDVQTASLGQVVDVQRIQELPLRERNPWELVMLAPGVANSTNLRYRKAGMTGAQSTFDTDGTGDRRGDFSIDGAPNTSSVGGTGGTTVAFAPPTSAVQEFRVQTASFDAANGNVSGASVTVMSKGGTNRFNGSGDFYFKSSDLDAQNVFEQRAGLAKKPYDDYLFGASAGGPIKQNKSFFFAAFEGNPYGVPKSYPNMSVPTEKMRRGDFSDLLALGSQYQLYDPATTRPDPNNPGRYIRDPLPGNIIPPARLSSMAQNMLKYMNLPNAVGQPDGRNNYISPNAVEEQTRYVVTTRVDHNFASNHRAFLRVSLDRWTNTKDQYFENDAYGYATQRYNRQVAVDDTYMLSNSLVLNSRVGYAWQSVPASAQYQGIDLAGFGFTPSLVSAYAKDTATFPQEQIGPFAFMTSASDVLPTGGINGYEEFSTAVLSAGATLNWVKNRHSVRVGPEVRFFSEDNAITQTSPTLVFGSAYTKGPFDNSTAAPYGQEMASFMMGYLTGGSMYIGPQRRERISRVSLFVQDEWKVTNKLTLNLGLRYEYETPLVEKSDAMVNGLDFTTPLPINAKAQANYASGTAKDMPSDVNFAVKGGMLYAAQNGRPRQMYDSIYTNFMPRVGVAYLLGPKSVVRGGWGMYYDSLAQGYLNANQAGYTRVTPVTPTIDNGVTFQATPANPFPAGFLQPLGNAQGMMTDLGVAVGLPFVGTISAPLTHKFSAGFQRELPGAVRLDVTYVGNRQFHQPVPVEMNPTPRKYLSTLPTRDQATINYLTAQLSNPFFGIPEFTAGMTGKTLSREQLLRAYPHYTSVAAQETTGKRWYNSAQISVDRRFSKGFTAQAAYTYSNTMEAVRYLNPSDTELHKVIATNDKPHVFVVSGLVDLPFGRGRALGSNWGSVPEAFLGGWQLGLYYRQQSGTPLGFGNFLFKPGSTIADVPMKLGQDELFAGLPANAAYTNPWFNTAAFETASAVQLASNIRTQPLRFEEVRAPGYALFDASLSKTVTFSKHARLKLRVQGFNLLNRVNMLAPATTATRSDFGTITSLNGYPRQFQLGATFEF